MSEPPLDSWADPVAAADAAATSLLRVLDDGQPIDRAAASLRRRTHEPLMLSLADAADDEMAAVAVRRFRDDLRDWSWLHRLALQNASATSFGVVSLGMMTRTYLHTVVDVSSGVPEVHTHSRAVARGLGYLGLPIVLGDPSLAAVTLIPARARHGQRIWTTTTAAEAVRSATQRGSQVVVLCHPAAVLSSKNRLAYRPDPMIIDVKTTSGVLS